MTLITRFSGLPEVEIVPIISKPYIGVEVDAVTFTKSVRTTEKIGEAPVDEIVAPNLRPAFVLTA
jgi:hypothetical protein